MRLNEVIGGFSDDDSAPPSNIGSRLDESQQDTAIDIATSDIIAEVDDGDRFENLVACHFLKRLHFLQDSEGERCELRYIRDKEKREVDFVIIRDHKVEELIEVKFSDCSVSTSLLHYAQVFKPRRAIRIVANLDRSFARCGVEVMSVLDYFAIKIW